MDVSGARWRKSSYSGGNNDCVEMAHPRRGEAMVRDSKNPAGGVLCLSGEMFAGLLAAVKASRLDG